MRNEPKTNPAVVTATSYPLSGVHQRRAFIGALRKWYMKNRRPLPWRDNPTLYKTVVSEFMLQQTQVQTVIPYFERWLGLFPDFASLAQAAEDEVLRAWEGLGYYKRARHLLQLARTVVSLPDSPTTADEWRSLPGIGPYTAAAIASISFGQPVACLDGNVIRVLARVLACSQIFPSSASAAKSLASIADGLIKSAEPGLHNQAMMELGATVCLRTKPNCPNCPLLRFCIAGQSGKADEIPQFRRRRIRRRNINRILIRQKDSILLHQASGDSPRLAYLYEIPNAAVFEGKLDLHLPFAVKKRSISNERITEQLYQHKLICRIRRTVNASPSLHWIHLEDLKKITLSGPHRRWLNEFLPDFEE